MVFIGGPRRVGKTYLSLQFLNQKNKTDPGYLNWDEPPSKKLLMNFSLPSDRDSFVFDEIHKYTRWKSLVKGYFDRFSDEKKFIITGSSKLDIFQKGGDSLQGRYHYYRLHPFSLPELDSKYSDSKIVDQLFKFGGFPDPYLKSEERFLRRWHLERRQRLIREDIRDATTLQDLDRLELLAEALPLRVGSPLSIQNLRLDLDVSHETTTRWVQTLERFYYCFRIPPFGAPKIKAVKKEQKLYLWDWSLIEDPGPRFENMVASLLLKKAHYETDVNGHDCELRYMRTNEAKEIDFVFIQKKKPVFGVECKLSPKSTTPSLKFFAERVELPVYYVVSLHGERTETKIAQTRVIHLSFADFCKETECV